MTPDVLYEEVIEVEERVVMKQDKCEINHQGPVVTGTTGEKVSEIGQKINFPRHLPHTSLSPPLHIKNLYYI